MPTQVRAFEIRMVFFWRSFPADWEPSTLIHVLSCHRKGSVTAGSCMTLVPMAGDLRSHRLLPVLTAPPIRMMHIRESINMFLRYIEHSLSTPAACDRLLSCAVGLLPSAR